ncbi:V/A-type H+-transporting ATPase subunit I [Geosporobacter subterraneus DSM 17957]|uniref:V/A-type H+-transporting ATPase subunit I n=1 Tax=Geosporobacter subterraneus DSM 17957 TaxID=1121919 RepID=A0A1M6MTK7_9FIRM|nr:V-type ATPase 116kDa subunit family protein [Geosporobacter subterraneus]SHJ86848.1 V/A-type H+-transporting ATPase subunit I [Geosporobacter subterraneus DSM 17957]
MAVEKMEMLNVVAPITAMDEIAKEIVLSNNVHMVNALHEINESNFTIRVQEENLEELVDICLIRPYGGEPEDTDTTKDIKKLLDFFKMEPHIKEKYLSGDYKDQLIAEKIHAVYAAVTPVQEKIKELEAQLQSLEDFKEHIKFMKDLDVNLDELNDLKFFAYKIGILSKENRLKLKRNYENVSAVVLHIGSNNVGEVYLVISPTELERETNRILRSLNFQEIDMPKAFAGKPIDVMLSIDRQMDMIDLELKALYRKAEILKKEYEEDILLAYSRLRLKEEMMKVKKETACTNEFFYLAGWVPQREKESIRARLEQFGERVILLFKDTTEVQKYMIPPTKLKNNPLMKPFEALVNMYGIPSYHELDPTAFLGITYMLMFGIMFGDVGQGAVLWIMGCLLKRWKGQDVYGGILNRLGLSSMVFGFLYGSIFGDEHLLPALLIRPIEHIDLILEGSVAIGILLILISFGYNIINGIRQRNVQDGLLGRNGAAGLLFFIVLLLMIGNKLVDGMLISNGFAIGLLVLFGGLIIAQEPLANLMLNRRPLIHESPSSYMIESGFDIFETLLSMLSNTVSFIRIGAFALNHVGLFIAFQTMARMMEHAAGKFLILLLGNVIIICLEGLIVFIQGLRLEYYELFSKYYQGEGVAFQPVRLDYD